MQTSFLYNRLYTICSLKDGEQNTADIIIKRIFPKIKSDLPGMKCQSFDCSNKASLIRSLKNIKTEASDNTNFPIIFFDMHGNTDGLGLRDNSFVSWSELEDVFASINRLSGFNLTLIFSSCCGAYFAKQIKPTKPSPCSIILGPNYPITFPNSLKFDIFFDNFIRTNNIVESVRVYNLNTADKNDCQEKLYIISAYKIFISALNHYIKNDPDHAKKFISDQIHKLRLQGCEKEKLSHLADILTREASPQKITNQLAKVFFMTEIDPRFVSICKTLHQDINNYLPNNEIELS